MTKEELLAKLDEAETNEEIAEIGKELLTLDPESPYGKLAVWETMEYEEAMENLGMLREAIDKIRAVVEARELPALVDDDRDALVYATVMMNLGFSLLSEGETEEAYEIAKELANFDDEGAFESRTLLYRCMLDLELYGEIIDALEADPIESVVGEHARAIALLETGAEHDEVFDAINYAISLSPNVPFFVVNIWDMPESDEDADDEEMDVLNDAAYLAEPWCATDKRLAALSAQTFLFGYLTDRLADEKEMKVLREGYENAGIADRIEAVRKHLKEMGESGRDPEEIDAEALSETANILSELEEE
ncbi:hypothetical protein [Cloacibacillus sp. An23]|uniref:hypothetical protein n=1 Tax=Cloacibacillus sp. An23 TaxID=1965591 RepID=UPI000B3A2415|nr:hypothetical protein [Cloacibacillus sp. An23]OUO93999.1 hypothetical protein B5F39_04860 [Cloacibacillus sp. An23]